MAPTPYRELNQVLDTLVSRLQHILASDFVGAYLQGSFATGGFDEHSDVDFVVAIKDDLAPRQVDALQAMHDQVYHLGPEWAKHLEGSYFPAGILRDPAQRGLELWYLDHGARSMIRSDHCNTILVRWIVRERGVTLAGPPPQTLIDPIPEASLVHEIYEALNGWGQKILDDPAPYNNRFYQGFIVLNYSRMLHDIHRGYPGSKPEGAEWAKAVLDPSWSDLIDRTWACRPDPARTVREPADPVDFARTLEFVAYVMDQSKRYLQRTDPRTSPGRGTIV
jgi:hypothetical protein